MGSPPNEPERRYDHIGFRAVAVRPVVWLGGKHVLTPRATERLPGGTPILDREAHFPSRRPPAQATASSSGSLPLWALRPRRGFFPTPRIWSRTATSVAVSRRRNTKGTGWLGDRQHRGRHPQAGARPAGRRGAAARPVRSPGDQAHPGPRQDAPVHYA
jgi:hypothetical protein